MSRLSVIIEVKLKPVDLNAKHFQTNQTKHKPNTKQLHIY